jgi:hypothetical protein
MKSRNNEESPKKEESNHVWFVIDVVNADGVMVRSSRDTLEEAKNVANTDCIILEATVHKTFNVDKKTVYKKIDYRDFL